MRALQSKLSVHYTVHCGFTNNREMAEWKTFHPVSVEENQLNDKIQYFPCLQAKG